MKKKIEAVAIQLANSCGVSPEEAMNFVVAGYEEIMATNIPDNAKAKLLNKVFSTVKQAGEQAKDIIRGGRESVVSLINHLLSSLSKSAGKKRAVPNRFKEGGQLSKADSFEISKDELCPNGYEKVTFMKDGGVLGKKICHRCQKKQDGGDIKGYRRPPMDDIDTMIDFSELAKRFDSIKNFCKGGKIYCKGGKIQ